MGVSWLPADLIGSVKRQQVRTKALVIHPRNLDD